MKKSQEKAEASDRKTRHPWYEKGAALVLQSEMCASQAVEIAPEYREARGSGKLGAVSEEAGCRGSWTSYTAMDMGGAHPIDRY